MIRSVPGHLRTGIAVLLILIAGISFPAAALTISQSGASGASSPTIANGDSVLIQGIATGQPRNGLQVWLIGNNYLKVSTVSVNDDNTFTSELMKADTQDLSGGQYFVVIQHPMMNAQFDIAYNPSTGEVTNKQLGANGMVIYRMSGSGSLQSPAGAKALVQAISSQNVDDTFTTYSFTINPPSALINPIGTHYVGDQFVISGSTNLAAGDNLQVEVTSASFGPTGKTQDSSFSGTSKTVQVVQGTTGKNTWSLPVDTSSYRPDEYLVKVSGITQDVTGSTTFQLLERPVTSATAAAAIVPPAASLQTTVPPTTAATLPPTTQKSAAGPGLAAFGGIAAVLALAAGRK